MKIWLIIGFFAFPPLVAFSNITDTTSSPPVFYERMSGETVRFFYDDHYFLVDKNCEFRAIERVGRYDFQHQVFIGEFADFDKHGRLVLEGNYVQGRKQGDFKAYHPNGQLKWQVAYLQGSPKGLLRFFYPDGKPLLEIAYTGEGVRILNFWDRRGRQRVTNGNGRYEFSVVADGYNEFGYTRYTRKGKVVDGNPHGNWAIKYMFDDGKEKNAGYEYYNKGRFVQGYEAYTDEEFFDAPRYSLLPVHFSLRAEAMVAKGCTIDDYTGFTGFLAEYLSGWFEGALDEPIEPVKIEFSVTVKKTGEPRAIKMESSFDKKRYADLLFEALDGIGYWLPSYATDKFIEDKLTVTMEAFPDAVDHGVGFHDVTIKREKGR